MTRKYLIGDLHLGHKNISRFRLRQRLQNPNQKWTPIEAASSERPVNEFIPMTSDEQHEATFESIACLGKRDILYVPGDAVFTQEWLERLKTVRCRMILVGGNHDLPLKEIVASGAFENVYGLHKHKGVWLSHAPIHPMELRGKINIHGHTHYELMLDPETGEPDPRYRNVCMEYTNFEPVLWDYVLSDEYFSECKWQRLAIKRPRDITN